MKRAAGPRVDALDAAGADPHGRPLAAARREAVGPAGRALDDFAELRRALGRAAGLVGAAALLATELVLDDDGELVAPFALGGAALVLVEPLELAGDAPEREAPRDCVSSRGIEQENHLFLSSVSTVLSMRF